MTSLLKKFKDFQADVEVTKLSQILQSTFPENVCLAQVVRWFDHNVIIRGKMFMRVAKFMTLKYICTALLGKAHVYTNSAELDAQSEQAISKSSAEKSAYGNSI